MSKYSPYSYSKIAVHQTCPKKFKYIYIDKIKKPWVETEALRKGRAVHSILEHYPNVSNDKNAKKYSDVVNKFLETPKAKQLLFRQSIREYRFALDSNLNECGYWDKKALFRGSIDYICVIDDTLYLCDWKTGKAKEQRFQDFNQLLFYSIYFFITRPNVNKINIEYVYVEHDGTTNSILLERQYLDNYKKEFLESIVNIENDVSFKPNYSKLCAFCDFVNDCDGAKEYLKEIDYPIKI